MKADVVLYNGRVYTVDPNHPWAEGVACANGRIIFVGTNEEVLALAGSKTQRVDAGGRLVLPGLIDAHVHFLQYAMRRNQVSLLGVDDFAEVQRRVQTAVAQAAPGQWVIGWGWDESRWDIAPAAAHLDRIAPHNPVALVRMDMHTWWVNSMALQQSGIGADTPDPAEGRIERDESGAPTGVLREWSAIALVEQDIPEPDTATLARWLREAIAEAHRLGLTGIHDQRIEREGQQSFRLWQLLRRQDDLDLRVHMNIAADFVAQAAALGLQPGFGDDRLWIGHVKAFADGTMGSRTAHMLEPYESEPQNTGIVVTSADELWQIAIQAAEAGFSLSVHAIGDRAVRTVLDVLGEHESRERALQLPLPHRIEHVQVIHPDDLPRLAQYNVVASVQPVHLLTDWPTAERVWGKRAQYAYAFRSLQNHGTRLAFGSDAPVAPLNPLLGIYAAVTRQDLEQQPAEGWYSLERLSIADTIAAYTVGPAYLAGKQHLQGTISSGKWADMIVLSQNLFEIEPGAIVEAAVVTTIFGGKVVYYI